MIASLKTLKDERGCSARAGSSKARSYTSEHMHGYLQIFFVKDGECVHDIFGSPDKINAGEISIAPPFNAHSVDGRDSEYEMFGLDADNDFFTRTKSFRPWNFHDVCLSPLCLSVSEKGHVLRPEKGASEKMSSLWDELHRLDGKKEQAVLFRGKCIELISLIAAEYVLKNGKVKTTADTGNCAPINKVFEYIHAHFRDDISAAGIAKNAMVSERTLYRIFEESMDMPVHRYIRSLRLGCAKELLKNEKLTVSDVANATGFEYTANFHRFFREETGISPAQYRERYEVVY